MKCAKCEKMHQGLIGLTPVQKSIPTRNHPKLAYFDMLCGDCMRAEKEQRRKANA